MIQILPFEFVQVSGAGENEYVNQITYTDLNGESPAKELVSDKSPLAPI